MLGPTLLVTSWENIGLKDHLETAYADRLALAGQLTLDQLAADHAASDANAIGLPAPLRRLSERLAEQLPATAAPQVRLESGAPPTAAAPTLGNRPNRDSAFPPPPPNSFSWCPTNVRPRAWRSGARRDTAWSFPRSRRNSPTNGW